jgi:c-di-GMP-binding flagellar brake protein YcgR
MLSATSRDLLADAVASKPAEWHAGVERRRTPRVSLHWTLHLICDGTSNPLRTQSRDISRDGFYCFLNQPLKPGDRVKCDIVVPTHRPHDRDDVVYLRCNAMVLRVEKLGNLTEFGIACQIEDYCVFAQRGCNSQQTGI